MLTAADAVPDCPRCGGTGFVDHGLTWRGAKIQAWCTCWEKYWPPANVWILDPMPMAVERWEQVMDERAKKIEACARAAHEVNRAYCLALGDASQVAWELAPEWQRTSALKGVEGALADNTPAQSHASWLAEKWATGWIWGPVKDAQKKEHPCMVPYEQLPPAQQHKDALFVGTARAMAAALGLVEAVG